MAPKEPQRRSFDRRTFIKTSAGAAIAAAPAAVAFGVSQQSDAGKPVGEPGTAPPQEPVMAYVHDPGRGEVTVMAGTRQTTYRDPQLARRLLDAAPQNPTAIGGEFDVLAP